MPDTCYSITQASRQLPDIVHFVEEGHTVELTRSGKSVAVLVSAEEYRSLHPSPQGNFWEALQTFRQQYAAELPESEELFTDVREREPGRPVVL
ncbi:MAG: type II toxin-antitoxin system Phd/YefM family antitoxin [bacterium]|nr:type II toxin-antitoxin system Phd/YefM family antitoxin [bacterium]